MKDQLVDGWTTEPLSEIATFSNGLWKGKKGPFTTAKVLRNTNFRPHGALSLDDVAEIEVESKQLEKRRLQKGDIILERSGGGPKQPVGRVVLFNVDDGVFSFSNFTSVVRITDKTKVEPAYLHQVLNWWHASGVTEGIQSRSTGIRNLDFKTYKTLEVPLPPLEEQRRIVAVLDEAFEGLARARAHAEANLQNAWELFESFLGDQFLHGGVGNKNCTVGDLITLQRGFDITKKDQREGPFPVVSSGGIKSHHDTPMAKAPGVVIGRKGSIGSVYFVEEDFWPHDTTLWVKDFKGNDPQLVYYLMRGLSLIELDTGAANPSLNRNLVHPLVMSWPEENNQSEIATRIYEVEVQSLELQRYYSTKLQDLDDLRQSLLQKAFAGELT